VEEVEINQCIFGVKIMNGIWKEKKIDYNPGRLMVGILKGGNKERAIQIIEQHNCKIDYIGKDTIDVFVDSFRTLEIASKLEATGAFRFVSPEIKKGD
jgi:hypothetical protein